MDTIQTAIRKERGYLFRWTCLRIFVFSVILSLVPILIVGFIDFLFPMRERAALGCFMIAMVVSGCFVMRYLYQSLNQIPDERTIALIIEKSHPELMDSLICSTELLSQSNQKVSSVGQLLIDNVSRGLDKNFIHSIIKTKIPGSLKLFVLAVFGIVLVFLTLSLPILGKAYLSTKDILLGSSSGIVVEPGNTEIAKGDDVKIEAFVSRGMPEPTLTLKSGNEVYHYDMYGEKDRKFSFKVFSVGGSFSYHISTPSLKSQTFHVTTYDKPEIISSGIDVSPPPYTLLEFESFKEIKDISVPAGSTVSINITPSSPGNAAMQIENKKSLDFKKIDSATHNLTLTIVDDISYKISLTDLENHLSVTNEVYHIESIADFSPVIQILAPEENEIIREDSDLSFLFKITDDYTVESVRLHLFVSGEENEVIEIFEKTSPDSEAIKQEIIAYSISLKDRVKNGDVISYYCSAVDNAKPKSNRSKSTVQFVEIRPEKPDLENNQDGNSGETKTLSVSDLIVEQKRIIRSTLDEYQKNQPASVGNDHIDDLIKSASELYLTTKNRYQELKGSEEPEPRHDAPKDFAEKIFNEAINNINSGSSQTEDLGIIGELFEDSIINMGKAKDILVKRLLIESLTYQQLALSKLISIEIELDKNPPPSEGQGEGEESTENQEISERNKKKSQQQKAMILDKTVEDLERLINKQNNINDEISGSRTNKKDPGKFIEFLSEEESDVIDRTVNVKKNLKKIAKGSTAVNELSKAIRHMNDALGKIANKQLENAYKYGRYSTQFLERTKEIINNLQAEMVTNELKSAAAMLKSIMGSQSDLMQKIKRSQKLGNIDSVKSELMADQKRTRLGFDKFLNQIAQISSEMESVNARASLALEETLNAAFKSKVSGKMKRVENAIRYRQVDKALDYQKQSHQTLRELYQKLEDIIQENFSLSGDEIAKMLDKVLRSIEKVKQADSQDKSSHYKQDLYEEIAEDLDDISDKLNSRVMDEIVGAMQQKMSGQQSSDSQSDQEFLALLYKSAGLLEAGLMKEALKGKVNLARVSDEEPLDKYKKLINKYFKNLSKTF